MSWKQEANIYLVASDGNATSVHGLLDGIPVIGDTAGTDLKSGIVTVKNERLYTIVEGKDYGIRNA
jgi:hypothetical protein